MGRAGAQAPCGAARAAIAAGLRGVQPRRERPGEDGEQFGEKSRSAAMRCPSPELSLIKHGHFSKGLSCLCLHSREWSPILLVLASEVALAGEHQQVGGRVARLVPGLEASRLVGSFEGTAGNQQQSR